MGTVVPYPQRVKEKAFSLYCQHYSAARIAQHLPEILGSEVSPTSRTIKNWIRVHRWKERRDQVHRETMAIAENHCAQAQANLLTRLTGFRDDILTAATSLPFKSAEGAIRSFNIVQQAIDRMVGTDDQEISREQLDHIVEAIFLVLRQDEELGPVLLRREWTIFARIEAALQAHPL